MITLEDRSKGGRTSAVKSRQIALDKYYDKPNICLQCKKVIEVKPGQKITNVRQKKFCGSNCAAQYNNKHRERKPWSEEQRQSFSKKRREGTSKTIGELESTQIRIRKDGPESCGGTCERCKIYFNYKAERRSGNGFVYFKRRFCDDCLSFVRSENAKEAARRNGQHVFSKSIGEVTKGELREYHTGSRFWQAYIGKHARKSYKASGRPYVCQHCGYSRHVEVCHIENMADFPDTALISEINSPKNLTALCRNCHWVFDHGTHEEKQEILDTISTS
jgi:hypothetical protein